ncbi:MAG TPA: alpha/beta hydrolase [Smithellaceae bacterium]|nr:alpha/beta hydrolase [Smithellaceae bacterium]
MELQIPDLKYQDVGGAQLPYLFYEGGAPQMLFVHATGFLPWLWHPIIAQFVPGHSVWAPYICNYRSCNPYEGGLSWDVVAQDLAAFCRAQQIDHPVVIGHSMGATVISIATALYGLTPEKMILIEPIFLPDEFYRMKPSVKDHPLASRSIKRVNYWKSEDEAMAYLKSRSFFSDWNDEILSLYKQFGMEKLDAGDMQLTCTPQSEAAMFMGGWSIDPWPLLPKISCPALVIEGLKSPNVGLVDIRRAVSALPRGIYESVADAGHLIPMEKPAEIASIIGEFAATQP